MQSTLLERKCFYLYSDAWYTHLVLSSIEGVVEKWGINETFVGLILLPIVGK